MTGWAPTEREREILDLLLSVEGAGVAELRAQAETAEVVGQRPCGCATIDLAVDRARAPRSPPRSRVPIDATTPFVDDESAHRSPLDLLLFLDDGWLHSVEVVYYGEVPPAEFPAPSAFDKPVLRERPPAAGS